MKTVGHSTDGNNAAYVLESPHTLPDLSPCCIDGLVCADAILH